MADKNIEITLKGVRMSFANIFAPQEFVDKETGKKRYTYNANFLVPKRLADGSDNPVVKQIADAMKAALAAQWGDNPPKIPAERRCFRDGEPKDPDSGEREASYDGYEGHYFLSANKAAPLDEHGLPILADNPLILVDSRKGADGKFPRLKERDGKLYSGAYVDAILRIYGFDGKKKDVPSRINASLEAIKFVRHGDAFGAKPVDADNRFDEEDADDGFDDAAPKAGAAASEDDDMLG